MDSFCDFICKIRIRSTEDGENLLFESLISQYTLNPTWWFDIDELWLEKLQSPFFSASL